MFPFHARSFERSGKIKVINVISVTVGILLPLVPIISPMAKFGVDIQKKYENSTVNSFLSGGLGFMPTRFPTFLCTAGDGDVNFYSMILMLEISLALGITLLIIILWSVYKVSVKQYILHLSIL